MGRRILLTMCPLLVAAACAEERPNFTGTWKQVGALDRTHIDKIEHQDPSLKVVTTIRETPTGPSSLQRPLVSLFHEMTHRTDGTEEASKSQQGRERWTTVYWQGPALVFQTVDKKDCHVTVTRVTWTLSEDGKTLTKAQRVIRPDGLAEQKFVFEKQ